MNCYFVCSVSGREVLGDGVLGRWDPKDSVSGVRLGGLGFRVWGTIFFRQ